MVAGDFNDSMAVSDEPLVSMILVHGAHLARKRLTGKRAYRRYYRKLALALLLDGASSSSVILHFTDLLQQEQVCGQNS